MTEQYGAANAEVDEKTKLKPGEILAQVKGKAGGVEFTAGFVYDTKAERVVVAAPIIHKAINRKTRDEIRAWAERCGHRVSMVREG
jgi:hypothetical protein